MIAASTAVRGAAIILICLSMLTFPFLGDRLQRCGKRGKRTR